MILALSERQLAQTEWLGTIRSLSGAVGLEVAQPVADTVRIGVGRVSLDMAQCDAALGGGAHDQQVVTEEEPVSPLVSTKPRVLQKCCV